MASLDEPHSIQWLTTSLQSGFDEINEEMERRHKEWIEEFKTVQLGGLNLWLNKTLAAERGAVKQQLKDLRNDVIEECEGRQSDLVTRPGDLVVGIPLGDKEMSEKLRGAARGIQPWGQPAASDRQPTASERPATSPELGSSIELGPRAPLSPSSVRRFPPPGPAPDLPPLPLALFESDGIKKVPESRALVVRKAPDSPQAPSNPAPELWSVPGAIEDDHDQGHAASRDVRGLDEDLISPGRSSGEATPSKAFSKQEVGRDDGRKSSATSLKSDSQESDPKVNGHMSDGETKARELKKKDAQSILWGSEGNRSSRITDRIWKRAASKGSNAGSDDDDDEEEEVWGYCWLLEEIVNHPRFETSFAALITINSLIMALQTQYNGIQVGYEIEYPGSLNTAKAAWPLAVETFFVVEWMFATVFAIELLMKIFALGRNFFKDKWNLLDAVTVIFWYIESIAHQAAKEGVLPFPPMLLRLARLVRLLRLLRLVRKIQTFDSLYIMTASIKGSAYALIWSTVLLCVVQMVLALWLNVMVMNTILDESEPLELRMQTYKYYGTFTRCCLTMFELTLANWIDPARVLFDNVSEYYIFFILSHQLIIGFAMVRVITGVFLHETFKVASSDDTIMLAENERATKLHTARINRLLEKGDSNDDGLIDKDEFADMMADPTVKTWMAAIGLAVNNHQLVFKLIDEEDSGEITPEQLVKGIARLKGAARSIDLSVMLKQMDQTRETLDELVKVAQEKNLKDVQGWQPKRREGKQETWMSGKSRKSRASSQSAGTSTSVSKKSSKRGSSKNTVSTVRSINATLKGRTTATGLQKLVTGPKFEVFFIGLIVLSSMMMAAEGQYEGFEAGYRIGFRTTTRPAAEVWPGAPIIFEVCEWTFGVIFAIEVVLRIIALRLEFVRDLWCLFDLTVVVSWVVGRLEASFLPLDPLILRLCRLMRLARLLRLIKTINGFDSLYLMVTALKGSLAALAWSTVLLFVVQMMLALFLVEMVQPFIMDPTKDENVRHQVYKYYGTFSRSMLTMFEITLANWAPPARVLAENVNEWFMIFNLLHKFVIGFAVVLVIQGVFMQQTFKVAATDDTIMTMQQTRATEIHRKKMQLLFLAADEDGNGLLDREEFEKILGERAVRTWLAAMELQVDDVDKIFELLCGEDDGMTADELVSGVSKLKGGARSLDLHVLMIEHRKLLDGIEDLQQKLEKVE